MSRQSKSKKTFAQRAYQNTHVDATYTREKIESMLNEIGITKIRITQMGIDWTVEFIVKLKVNEAPRKVRIDVPLHSELGEDLSKAEHRKDVMFRVLYWHLRDKFIAVQQGLKEFEEEFLADLVIMQNGKEIRIGDALVPKYKEMLKQSNVAVFSIKGGSDN